MTVRQIPFSLSVRENSDFENYFISNENAEVVKRIKSSVHDYPDSVAGGVLYVHGESQTGRTHLLEAACLQAQAQGLTMIYLSMTELVQEVDCRIFEGLELLDLVCIDDVDIVAGNEAWEEALFHLHNRARAQGQLTIYSAAMAPRQLPFVLSDMSSRLNAALIYKLLPLSDEDKKHCLILRAANLGFDLSLEVAEFILKRGHRQMASLVKVLDDLDRESLAAQRKLTIPFVKQVMNW